MKDGICSANFSRYGQEYSELILKFLNIKYYHSRINCALLIIIKNDNYLLSSILNKFFYFENITELDDDTFKEYYSIEINKNYHILEIVDFSTNDFRLYKKIIRKIKIKFIEECQKFS